jgi:hypothetical protein
MVIAVGGGLALRVLRRKFFFAGRLSLHKAFSFDALFQAAILLNPQLRYPDVECEFLATQTNSSPGNVSSWFAVREAAAAAIPLALASVTAALAGLTYLSAGCAIGALLWIALRSHSATLEASERSRFVGAVALGILASIWEGLAFVQACGIAYPAVPAWSAFMLYGVTLAAFELSPIPFALGTLEMTWLALEASTSASVPGLLVVEGYRLGRAAPVLLLMLFYLPRYKMSVRDIFDARLAAVLARTRRRPIAEPDSPAAPRPLLSIVIPAYNEA